MDTNIPALKSTQEISGAQYVVEAGDTLFAIAFYSGNDYRDLAKYNDLKKPFSIYPGQTLTLRKTKATDNPNKNKDINTSSKSSTKVVVDPPPKQAYGQDTSTNHRKKLKKTPDSSKISVYNKSWIWPASGVATTTVVGSDGTIRGLDIKGRLGAPVVSSADGKVVYAGNALKGYGNLVIVKHDNDFLSAYAHNDTILVNEQAIVKQGQAIATMGQSGSNAVRLHFEIRQQGKSLDPLLFLPRRKQD